MDRVDGLETAKMTSPGLPNCPDGPTPALRVRLESRPSDTLKDSPAVALVDVGDNLFVSWIRDAKDCGVKARVDG